jgi:hypothetical protein
MVELISIGRLFLKKQTIIQGCCEKQIFVKWKNIKTSYENCVEDKGGKPICGYGTFILGF